jgi:hypothetical protein
MRGGPGLVDMQNARTDRPVLESAVGDRVVAAGRRSGIGAPPQMRGWGAVTDCLPWRFALHPSVSPRSDSSSKTNEKGSSALTPSFTAASSLTRPYPIAQGVKT